MDQGKSMDSKYNCNSITGSMLSPQADVFTPRSEPSVGLQNCPYYITNCYPFVQDGQGPQNGLLTNYNPSVTARNFGHNQFIPAYADNFSFSAIGHMNSGNTKVQNIYPKDSIVPSVYPDQLMGYPPNLIFIQRTIPSDLQATCKTRLTGPRSSNFKSSKKLSKPNRVKPQDSNLCDAKHNLTEKENVKSGHIVSSYSKDEHSENGTSLTRKDNSCSYDPDTSQPLVNSQSLLSVVHSNNADTSPAFNKNYIYTDESDWSITSSKSPDIISSVDSTSAKPNIVPCSSFVSNAVCDFSSSVSWSGHKTYTSQGRLSNCNSSLCDNNSCNSLPCSMSNYKSSPCDKTCPVSICDNLNTSIKPNECDNLHPSIHSLNKGSSGSSQSKFIQSDIETRTALIDSNVYHKDAEQSESFQKSIKNRKKKTKKTLKVAQEEKRVANEKDSQQLSSPISQSSSSDINLSTSFNSVDICSSNLNINQTTPVTEIQSSSNKNDITSDAVDLNPGGALMKLSNPHVYSQEICLHLNDDFPDLSQSFAQHGSRNRAPSQPMSYSDILKKEFRAVPDNEQETKVYEESNKRGEKVTKSEKMKNPETSNKSNKQRKRDKKKSRSGSQQRDVATSSLSRAGIIPISKVDRDTHQGSGPRYRMPITLDITEIITSKKSSGPRVDSVPDKQPPPRVKDRDMKVFANPLDSRPAPKRGKEREKPKTKRKSQLKKVILKEREEKKHQQEELKKGNEVIQSASEDDLKKVESKNTTFCENTMSSHENSVAAVTSADSSTSTLSTTSQPSTTSQICASDPSKGSLIETMSCILRHSDNGRLSLSAPLSSVCSEAPQINVVSCNSHNLSPPVSQESSISDNQTGQPNVRKIHSRRFREYCTQVLDKDIDNTCVRLLQDLLKFQERAQQKDPIKAKSKRRIVMGLREVTKHVSLKKITCLIVSPNLEKIKSQGGLDEQLSNLLDLAQGQNVPIVFALNRRALGWACKKKVPVSVVGVFNYSGSEENFKKLMDLTNKARLLYDEMISKEQSIVSQSGHSRSSSTASGLSLSNSVSSEPVATSIHSERHCINSVCKGNQSLAGYLG